MLRAVPIALALTLLAAAALRAQEQTPVSMPFRSRWDAAPPGHVQPAVAYESAEGSQTGAPPNTRASRAAGTLPLERAEQPLPLQPPASDGDRGPTAVGAGPSLVTLLASLAIVCGLFCVAAWALRRGLPKSQQLLPKNVVEVLGRTPIAGRHQVYLVRCGGKLLLLAVTPTGIDSLAEITDPVEVDRLAGLCVQTQRQSSTRQFQETLRELEAQPPAEKPRAAFDFAAYGTERTAARGGRHA